MNRALLLASLVSLLPLSACSKKTDASPKATPTAPAAAGAHLPETERYPGGTIEATAVQHTLRIIQDSDPDMTTRLVATGPSGTRELRRDQGGSGRLFGLFSDGADIIYVMSENYMDSGLSMISAWRYRVERHGVTLDRTYEPEDANTATFPSWIPHEVHMRQLREAENAKADLAVEEEEGDAQGAINEEMVELATPDGTVVLTIVEEPGVDEPGVLKLVATHHGTQTVVYVDDRKIGAEQLGKLTLLADDRVEVWMGQMLGRYGHELTLTFKWDAKQRKLVQVGKPVTKRVTI